MAQYEKGLGAPQIDVDEHVNVNGVNAKRVLAAGYDGANLQDLHVDTAGNLGTTIESATIEQTTGATHNDLNIAVAGKDASGKVQPIPITANGVKVDGSAVTQPVSVASLPNQYLPLATNVSSTLTLTNADTAYQITEPTSNFIVTYCNNSDTDMYWGFATLTTGGIKLASGGGVVTLSCAANASPFFYCASAGKVLNYTTSVL